MMLATRAYKIPEGWIVQPKLDGVRAYTKGGVLYARSGKPIRNKRVQKRYAKLPDGLDGELVAVTFPQTVSIVNSYDAYDTYLDYVLFDWHLPDIPYSERLRRLEAHGWNCWVISDIVSTEGYPIDGVIARNPEGLYVPGRSKDVLKIKQWDSTTGVCDEIVLDIHGMPTVIRSGNITISLNTLSHADRVLITDADIGRKFDWRYLSGEKNRMASFLHWRDDL